MKRNTPQHPKTDDLMDRLDIRRYQVVGLLESLWHITAASTPAGDIGRFTNTGIARRLDWDGEADELINALCESGWLDKSEEHRLIVHDWWDHAEDSVHMKVARAGLTFADGKIPKLGRLSTEERAQCMEKIEQNNRSACTQDEHEVHAASDNPINPSRTTSNDPCTHSGHDVGTAQALALAKAKASTQTSATPGSGTGLGTEAVLEGGGGRVEGKGPMSEALAKIESKMNLHHGEINQLLIYAGVESDRVRATISQRKDLTPKLVEQVIRATSLDPATDNSAKLIAFRLKEWTTSKLQDLANLNKTQKRTA